MEQTQEMVSVRALVDKEKNKVVFVEAGGDFVDILLSFLTLPMATIIRLINACPDGPPDQVKIGSLSTLYQSVVNIYFLCRNCCSGLSTKENSRCSCGKLMNWKIGVKEDSNVGAQEYEGILVSESASFIITDDLRIKEKSVGESLSIINNLGVKDMKKDRILVNIFWFKGGIKNSESLCVFDLSFDRFFLQ